ncbi:MAG: hypothetical protein KDB05_28220 [Planctomycetales bacterium]|nr:hypothetical protein [Planctomycetales bacterium]
MAWAFLTLVLTATTVCAADDAFEQQRQRLANMSATDKQALSQRLERFERLPTSEQEKLRQLDTAIADDPQGEQLRLVMQRYGEWLRALPSSQRLEILSLPTTERVERVRLLLAEQERQRFQELFGSKLQLSDQAVLHQWVQALFEREKASILSRLTPLDRQRVFRVEDPMQRQSMMVMMLYRWNSDGLKFFELLKPTDEDMKQLAMQLSPLARDTLAAARDDKERSQLIQTWTRAAIESRVRPPATKDEIERFLDQHVTDEQRAYLESLPRERMRMELQRLYSQYRFNERPRPGMRKGPMKND